MSEINAPATLTTPWGSISFNPAAPTSDYFFLTRVSGLDGLALRAPIDDLPQADGAIVHPFLASARHVTIEGLAVTSSVASRNTLCDNLVAALASIQAADGTWSWTPTGGSLKTLTVRCDLPVTGFDGVGLAPKSFVFGLVAGDPTIT